MAQPGPQGRARGRRRGPSRRDHVPDAVHEINARHASEHDAVTKEAALDLLQRNWHFSPGTLNARVGQSLLAVNHGGEVHTVTEVEDFGGGIVPIPNA